MELQNQVLPPLKVSSAPDLEQLKDVRDQPIKHFYAINCTDEELSDLVL